MKNLWKNLFEKNKKLHKRENEKSDEDYLPLFIYTIGLTALLGAFIVIIEMGIIDFHQNAKLIYRLIYWGITLFVFDTVFIAFRAKLETKDKNKKDKDSR